MKKPVLLSIVLLVLFSACTGSPSTITSSPSPSPTPLKPTPTPVVYKNPLTGLGTETDISKNRPIAVMVNDLKAALPQCGVGSADLIYEVAAEGGITRMVAVYQDVSNAGKIGSVRSTRSYYLDIIQGLDAILIHAGASTYAYSDLEVKPISHIDGIYNTSIFYRDQSRMSEGFEHSLFTEGTLITKNLSGLIDELQHRDGYLSNLKFGTSSALSGAAANRVTVEFSSYKKGEFVYSMESGSYLISQFGEPYTDGNSGKQVAAKNVLVLFASHSPITNDDLSRIEVDLTGNGTGIYACNGKYVEIVWMKQSGDSQFIYKLKDGGNVVFAPGNSYINIVALNNEVSIS